MKTAKMSAIALGEFTSWGRQWLATLEAEDILAPVFEPSVAQFCKQILTPDHAPVVLIENTPESQNLMSQIRKAGQPAFLIWFGKTFTKEELHFAIQHRVYQVLENLKPENPMTTTAFAKVEDGRTYLGKFYRITRALKSLVLQAEQDGGKNGLINEVKSALQRIDRAGSHHEFAGMHTAPNSADSLPLFASQDLGDAIQIASELERTGVLKVRTPVGNEGQIVFLQGKPVSSETGIVTGLKAVYRMFTWKDSRFLFSRMDAEDCLVHEPIEMNPTVICETGRELKKRFDSFKKELPPLHLKLKANPAALTPQSTFTESQFGALSSVVSYETVEQVLDYSKETDVSLYEALIHLRKMGAIAVAS